MILKSFIQTVSIRSRPSFVLFRNFPDQWRWSDSLTKGGFAEDKRSGGNFNDRQRLDNSRRTIMDRDGTERRKVCRQVSGEQ